MGSPGLLWDTNGYPCLDRDAKPQAGSCWTSSPAYSRLAIYLSALFLTAMLVALAVREGVA